MNDITPEACESYADGHQMHWLHWNHVRESAPLSASVARLNGEGVVLSVDAGARRHPELSLWHHDMERLESVIEAEDTPILVYRSCMRSRSGTSCSTARPSQGHRSACCGLAPRSSASQHEGWPRPRGSVDGSFAGYWWSGSSQGW